MKKRIAIWMYGGIGTGNFSQGQPVLEMLIRKLAEEFDLIVYSQSLINTDYLPDGLRIRFAPAAVKNRNLRWLLLIKYFFADHFQKKFSLVAAFWGFPGGFFATLMAKILFLPSVVNLQGGDAAGIRALNYGVMHRPWFKRLALFTYSQATVLTALTYFQRDMVIGNGVSRSIQVIPLGVDPTIFKVFPGKTRPGDPHHFIHVSNYNLIKDPETLLRAFALICKTKAASLRIVGGEYDKSNLQQLCENLGIARNVDFYGPVQYNKIADQFAWADTILHTSLFEGQGIVITEAAMCGVMIAGTAVGLISDLGDQRAVVVPVGDFNRLAEKILNILDNPEVAMEMKKRALIWAREHDFFWTVNRYKEIFNEIG